MRVTAGFALVECRKGVWNVPTAALQGEPGGDLPKQRLPWRTLELRIRLRRSYKRHPLENKPVSIFLRKARFDSWNEEFVLPYSRIIDRRTE
jgi:hypothetical protein